MKLESLVQYMDEYLGVADHPDYRGAMNGLQVEGAIDVTRVVTAVDASEASIGAARDSRADLMIVHHGLFWGGAQPVTGRRYRRLAELIRAKMALYSCHLPLDSHVEVGNCALLAGAMGLTLEGRLGAYEGAPIGWWGALPEPSDITGLVALAERALGGPVRALSGGPERIERVGVLTGGGGSFIADAAELGLDAYVTGEGSHHSFFDAAELGVHVLFGGHYATEVFGVRALGKHIAERFDLEVSFLDQPTGL